MRQEGFRKFIEVKREKYDTSCDFRKNTLCESEQNPSSVCGKSFYCQQQQSVACACPHGGSAVGKPELDDLRMRAAFIWKKYCIRLKTVVYTLYERMI